MIVLNGRNNNCSIFEANIWEQTDNNRWRKTDRRVTLTRADVIREIEVNNNVRTHNKVENTLTSVRKIDVENTKYPITESNSTTIDNIRSLPVSI